MEKEETEQSGHLLAFTVNAVSGVEEKVLHKVGCKESYNNGNADRMLRR